MIKKFVHTCGRSGFSGNSLKNVPFSLKKTKKFIEKNSRFWSFMD